jgi:hypothetical protein
MPCNPIGAVDLDPLTFDVAPRHVIELSGGSYRLTATGFLHGGLLDPPVGRTILAWGSVDRVPTYDPGPANIPQRVGQADLVEGEPAVIDLPAGRLWLLNSNGVQIRLEACAPATVSATFWPRQPPAEADGRWFEGGTRFGPFGHQHPAAASSW